MSNRLIGDWTNKEINHFFELSKDGLIRTKYITRYYPQVSSFISTFIYGYRNMDDEV
jgi:membrane protein DedA with SNARE-associated domain